MSAEAIARLRKYVDGTATLGDSRSRVDDLRALLDAHAALEAAHTEALDALEKDYARGVADERARVIADLRARAKTQKSWTGESTVAAALRAEADRIEREKP